MAGLGPYVPADIVDAELRRLDVDPASETARVLLYLAGPYARRGDWFENTKTAGHRQAVAAVDAVFERCRAPSHAALVRALTAVGMPRGVTAAYLNSAVALRRFGDVWVRWGGSLVDKSEAVLHARGTPATSQDILAGIGADSTTLRGVREALYADDRFVRASRTWGLRAWGIDSYAGIVDELGARIDAAGGKMKVDELVDDVRARFPDVAEISVRTYLSTLAFVTEDGIVRRRTDSDKWPPVAPLNTARGAFCNGDNEVRLAVAVSIDVLRGSGLQIRPAVAAALGVNPGERRVFTSPYRDVAVAWRLSSTNGPSLGSLRAAAQALAADLKDTLVLSFGLDEGSLHVARIDAQVTGLPRLSCCSGAPYATRPPRWRRAWTAGEPTWQPCYAGAVTTTSQTSSRINADDSPGGALLQGDRAGRGRRRETELTPPPGRCRPATGSPAAPTGSWPSTASRRRCQRSRP